MEVYFLKSVACLAIFLLFYKLLLEKENMHVFKRFYLLIAMLAAVVIPFITFTTYIEPSPEVFQPLSVTPSEGIIETSANISDYLETGLWILYVLGVLFFSIKFCRNFLLILQRIRKNPKVKDQNFITVLLSEKLNPHTFFSYIFLNKIKYEQQEIPQEVIIHEQAHAIQKHSLDILLVEFAQILFWFNPLLFLLKDAIKLNHEFLADDSVLKKGTDPTGYKKTLLSYSSGGLESGLVNPINYSSIKKRFTVMKARTSKTAVWARSLLVLPLLAILIYGFSTKEVVEKSLENKFVKTLDTEVLAIKLKGKSGIFFDDRKLSINELNKVISRENYSGYKIEVEEKVPEGRVREIVQLMASYKLAGSVTSCTKTAIQEKATPEMVAEYNKMAEHYNSMPADGTFIKNKDYERMKYIYGLMTPEQKKNSEAFPVPSPPPPLNDKMVAEYNKLAKYYNGKEITEEIVQEEGFKRMFYIYGLMNKSQRENAEKLPPPPPPAPMSEEKLPAPPPPPVKVELPQAPPPPPPIKFEDLVADGATFYYNDNIITPEEARNLVEVEKKVNIFIKSTDDEKPIVRLTDKKIKK